MTQKTSKSMVASSLALMACMSIVTGTMILLLSYTNLYSGFVIAISIVFGIPFFVLSIRLNPQSRIVEPTKEPFWPTRSIFRGYFWGLVAFFTLFACFLTPILLFVAIFYFLRSGDSWSMVIIRILILVHAICIWKWWINFVITTFPNVFRGRLSDATIDEIMRDEPAEEPKTGFEAAKYHWKLLVIAIVAFCVAIGVIDFENPMLDIDAGPKRARGFLLMILWCRGNPNTITSAATLLAIVSAAIYVARIRHAALARNERNPDTGNA